MKFGRQLELYALPEWKDFYIPYRSLDRGLDKVVQGIGGAGDSPAPSPTGGVLMKKSAFSVGSGLSECQVEADDKPGPCKSDSTEPLLGGRRRSFVLASLNPPTRAETVEGWLGWVADEAARAGSFVESSLRELESQLEDLVETAERLRFAGAIGDPVSRTEDDVLRTDDASSWCGSPCDASNGGVVSKPSSSAPYVELRILESAAHVEDGVTRLRGFADLNHAALYKILKKGDKKIGTKTCLQETFPRLVKETKLGDASRFDALKTALRNLVEVSPQTSGLGSSSPEVVRLATGLGKKSWGEVNEFALAFSLGCSCSFLLSLSVLLWLPESDPETYSSAYFFSSMPVFRVVWSLALMLWCFGAVALACDKWDINYMFVLCIDPRCRVGSNFLLSRAAVLTVAWTLLFGMYVVDYKWNVTPFTYHHKWHWKHDEFIQTRFSGHYVMYPLALLVVMFTGLLMPSSIFRNRYRWGVLKSVARTAAAPRFEVGFADNIVGDVLTSLAKPLQDVPAAICYLTAAHPLTDDMVRTFREKGNLCGSVTHHVFLPFIAGLPYVFRALQCIRRYWDTKDVKHLYNFGKYISSLLVVVVSASVAEIEGDEKYLATIAVVVVTIFATVYCCIWDICCDWGLPHRGDFPKHLPTSAYWVCGFADVVLRFAWVQTLIPSSSLNNNCAGRVVQVSLISSLEIIRRSMWAVLRIEHEQLSNASGFRALLWVPSRMPVNAASIQARHTAMKKEILGV